MIAIKTPSELLRISLFQKRMTRHLCDSSQGTPAGIVLAVAMLSAIGLDDQPVCNAGEVDDERTNRPLTAEFVSVQATITQQRPQASLGVGHHDAQCAGVSIGHGCET
jgi:hypothetical protein